MLEQDRECEAAKRLVDAGLRQLATLGPDDLEAAAADLFAPDCAFRIAHPFNDLTGPDAAVSAFYRPLSASLRHPCRTHEIVAAGRYEGAMFVAVMGHYRGTMVREFVGIPAPHRPVWLRFGELYRIEAGRIAAAWMLPDLLDLMRQAGVWPLVPSLGAEAQWPAPARAANGRNRAAPTGADNLALVLAMHAALASFDGQSLESMDVEAFWTPDFAWYGPAGIGTAIGLDGFRETHQIPFLTAFPDRRGGQHLARIGDGDIVVTGGWPSVTATHSGDGFLGMPATGRAVALRVMDFYRCEGGKIAENWVPLDIIDLLRQIGYDVFARIAHLGGQPRKAL